MRSETIKVASWEEAEPIFDSVENHRHFAKPVKRDGRREGQARADHRNFFAQKFKTIRHFNRESDWPGCRRLGATPVRAITFLEIRRERKRIRLAAEPMVECEGGYCFSLEEALAVPPLPPTPERIAELTAKIREENPIRCLPWERDYAGENEGRPFFIAGDEGEPLTFGGVA